MTDGMNIWCKGHNKEYTCDNTPNAMLWLLSSFESIDSNFKFSKWFEIVECWNSGQFAAYRQIHYIKVSLYLLNIYILRSFHKCRPISGGGGSWKSAINEKKNMLKILNGT